MSKLLKKIIVIIIAIILVLSSIAMFLLIPRKSALPAGDIWVDEESFDIGKISSMQKSKDDDFSILAITDIQFDNPFKSKKQLKADLAKMVEQTNPDLVVTVGDNFAGIFNHFHVDAFTEIMDSLELPWAPIWGNHERDFDADLNYLAKEMQKSKNCLFKIGPTNIDGVGNYIINIKEDDNIAFSLVMMDCNEEIFVKDAKGKRVDAYYETPRFSQVEWYKDNISGINAFAKKIVPSILFTHVPLQEFGVAYEMYEKGDSEVELITGEGKVDKTRINYGLFDAALTLGSTKNMFFGHDHTNTTALKYKGINMAYVPKTGNFSSYNKGKTGGTHILLKNDGIIEYKNLYIS